ncbi:DUF4200 domain-containing protein [Flavobacterium sp. Root420]|uniref:DUF4200 domain-containing protein n=1 Tax=Flavobacterium sp. Root420 TaxID=1736533 RepID=UPI0006F87DB2|nr:DUF4200 domain-containing protein [Flavobacterium sp. Root420]KQW99225.1 hypothetical protein ASC72_09035 [Flavobacterium sp. Root420]
MKQKLPILFLFLVNAICFSQDLFSGGSNSWIFHTPDDGRTTLHIAPLIDNNYNFNYQTMFYNNGDVAFSRNVGIGTAVPSGTLELTKLNSNLVFDLNTNGICKIISKGWNASIDLHTFKINGIENFDQLNINTNGNIGIGTAAPEAKLDVNGTVQINGGANNFYGFGQSSSSKPIDIRAGSHYPYVFNWHEGLTFSAHSSYGGIRFYNQGYPDMFGTAVMVMSITNNNVGIGTTNPTNKLDVNGTIHSKEEKVDMSGWSDFVFKKDYNLPTLQEVEKYINEKGHLENIQEVLKNGVNLGEMNAKLLQKIEELTLYMIEQNKEIKELKKENESFKSVLSRISKFENKLQKQ